MVKTVASDITSLLRDPLPNAEIPIKVTTYTFREAHTDKIRLLIAADIDRPVNTAGDVSVGYVLVDFDHKLAASQLDTKMPPTARRVGDTQRYFSTALLNRGRYTLKLAAVDDAGRRGTIERVVRAQLNVAGPLQVTDLLIADSAGTDGKMPAAPTVEADFTGGMLIGTWSCSPNRRTRSTRPAFRSRLRRPSRRSRCSAPSRRCRPRRTTRGAALPARPSVLRTFQPAATSPAP